MAQVAPIQSSFNGGEISPLLYGRVDVPRYKESLAVCQNYIPLIQGPITRRPGTGFVQKVKDSSAKTRLMPFVFSTSQDYTIEFGNLYCRFFKNNAPLTAAAPAALTAITQANPASVHHVSHGYITGDCILIQSVLGMTEVNNVEFTITKTDNDNYTLGVDSTGYTAYSSGGTDAKIYEIVSPYSTSQIFQVQFAQINDIIYTVHPSVFPYKLTRFSELNWQFNQISGGFYGGCDGPYLDTNITDTTLTKNYPGVGAYDNYTFSAVTGVNGGAGMTANDVGRVFRMFDGTAWTYNLVIAVGSTTTFTAIKRGANIAATTTWRLGVWSIGNGYPNAVCFHQNRLVYGGAGEDPTRFDGSTTGDYENFGPTGTNGTALLTTIITAANAYSFSLASSDSNPIQWITSDLQGMLMGTSGGEWVVTASDGVSAISATSVSAKKTTSHGSEPIQAVQSGKCTLFCQKGGKKLRDLNYVYINGFAAADLTQLSEHMSKSGFVQLAVQKSPQPIVWAIRNDGVLVAMTYERDLDALKVGWARHVLGGSGVAVESVAVVPTADGTSEDVWLIVKRTVNGATVRYVEYITQLFGNTDSLTSAFFVDSGLTYNGAATLTISGINHLNGQNVSILADGAVQSARGVVNGKITLDSKASIVTVGLGYNSDGQKLRIDAGAANGTAMGKTRRTHRIGILLYNTLGFTLGPDFSSLDDCVLDNPDGGTFDQSSGTYSGITRQPFTSQYDFENNICWRQSDPLPGTICGMYPMMELQDDA